MIVPTVIAMAAPIAARITHCTASPRSGSSSRTRRRAASNSAMPNPTSGNSAANVTRSACTRLLISLLPSNRQDFRHGGVAEEQQKTEAEHDLGDEHRLRPLRRRSLQIGELPVAQAGRLGPQARLGLRAG